MTAYEQILDLLGEGVTRRNRDQAEARCPAHDDRHPSLSIGVRDRGDPGAVLTCQAGCRIEDVLAALDLPMAALYDQWWERRNGHGSDPIEVYYYADEQGTVLFEVGRFPGKRFFQRRPGRNDWRGGIKGVRRVLYRLPKVIAAIEAGQTIYLPEGEKDVHAIERAGGVATCNPGGAGKWRKEYAAVLIKADKVVVVRDRDGAGRKHAADILASLPGARLVEPKTGKDAYDHLAAGHGLEDFAPVTHTARPAVARGFVTLAQKLGLDKLGRSITHVRVIGRGSRAMVIIALDNGDEIHFERIGSVATPAKLAAEVTLQTGARPVFRADDVQEVLGLIHDVGELQPVVELEDRCCDYGARCLAELPVQQARMDRQAERWSVFAEMARADVRDSRHARFVIEDPQSGLRYLRVDWFRSFVRSELLGSEAEAIVAAMPVVGWTKPGKEGRIKATDPMGPRSLIWAFFVIPRGWS